MGIKVRDWFSYETNEEQLHKLFYNMSVTMKYIHSYDYYISSFNLSEIEIVNPDTLTPIKYNCLDKLEVDDDFEKINRNIYLLALLQVGVYTNTLNNLNEKFIKENFNEFENFLPEKDVSYLRGVIQYNRPVYYCDYVNEKNKREIEALEKEAGVDGSNAIGMKKVKSTSIGVAYADESTQSLYSSLDEKQSAFVTFLILPILMVMLGVMFLCMMVFLH